MSPNFPRSYGLQETRGGSDFPGGTVDLHFRFTLRDGRIARLVIEA